MDSGSRRPVTLFLSLADHICILASTDCVRSVLITYDRAETWTAAIFERHEDRLRQGPLGRPTHLAEPLSL